jgi:hypothetical protein
MESLAAMKELAKNCEGEDNEGTEKKKGTKTKKNRALKRLRTVIKFRNIMNTKKSEELCPMDEKEKPSPPRKLSTNSTTQKIFKLPLAVKEVEVESEPLIETKDAALTSTSPTTEGEVVMESEIIITDTNIEPSGQGNQVSETNDYAVEHQPVNGINNRENDENENKQGRKEVFLHEKTREVKKQIAPEMLQERWEVDSAYQWFSAQRKEAPRQINQKIPSRWAYAKNSPFTAYILSVDAPNYVRNKGCELIHDVVDSNNLRKEKSGRVAYLHKCHVVGEQLTSVESVPWHEIHAEPSKVEKRL